MVLMDPARASGGADAAAALITKWLAELSVLQAADGARLSRRLIVCAGRETREFVLVGTIVVGAKSGVRHQRCG